MTRHEKRFKISSFIYRARRPFHPARLNDLFLEPFFANLELDLGEDEDDDEEDDEGDDEGDEDAGTVSKVQTQIGRYQRHVLTLTQTAALLLTISISTAYITRRGPPRCPWSRP